MRLAWTARALNDLQRLQSFIARENPDAAKRAIKTIRAGVKILAAHPRIGRPVETAPEYREWLIRFGASVYVVLYRMDDRVIAVLAVRHGREAGY